MGSCNQLSGFGVAGSAAARAAARRELVGMLTGEDVDRAACDAALEFATLLRFNGIDDVACAFERAVAMFAEDADVRVRACMRSFENGGPNTGTAATKSAPELEVAVASIESLRKSVESGGVDARSSAVVVSTSRPEEVGFSDREFAAEMTLHYDDVADPAKKGAFTRSLASDAAEFVLGLPESVERLYCACDGGVSRSAGIASAVLLFLRGTAAQVTEDAGLQPNPLVFELLLTALEETSSRSASPLRRSLERRLGEFAKPELTNAECGAQDFKLALELDLIAQDNVANSFRRFKTADCLDRILPDGAFLDLLYSIEGDAAFDLARWIEAKLADDGCRVLAVGRGSGVEPHGHGRIERVGIHGFAQEGPDGAMLLRTLLETARRGGGAPDAIVIESYLESERALLSRYPESVRSSCDGDEAFDAVARVLPGAVFVVDDRAIPDDGAEPGKAYEMLQKKRRLGAYESLTAEWANGDKAEARVSRERSSHTRSTVDAGARETTVRLH